MSKKGEVATKTQFTQGDIPSLIEKVSAQLESLTGGQEEESSTKGIDCPGFGTLENIDDVQDLIKAHSSINAKESGFNASVKQMKLKLKLKPMTINGIEPEKWRVDIMARIKVVANKVEIEKLKKIKKTLESNLSAADKLDNDLKAIHDDIGEMSF